MRRRVFNRVAKFVEIGDRLKVECMESHGRYRIEGRLIKITDDGVLHLHNGFFQDYRTIIKIVKG